MQEDEEAEAYQNALHEVAKVVMTIWNKDDWVAVLYEDTWYPAVINEVLPYFMEVIYRFFIMLF